MHNHAHPPELASEIPFSFARGGVRTEGVEDPAPGTWLVRVWETDPEEAENVRANLPEAGDEAKRRRGLEGHPPCASSCSRMAFSCFCPSLSPAELHPTESQLVAAHHYPGKVAPCQDHEPKSRPMVVLRSRSEANFPSFSARPSRQTREGVFLS